MGLVRRSTEGVWHAQVEKGQNNMNKSTEETITDRIAIAVKDGNEVLAALGHKPTRTVRLLLAVSVDIEIPADADPLEMFNNSVTYSFIGCDETVEVVDTNIEDIEVSSDEN